MTDEMIKRAYVLKYIETQDLDKYDVQRSVRFNLNVTCSGCKRITDKDESSDRMSSEAVRFTRILSSRCPNVTTIVQNSSVVTSPVTPRTGRISR